MFEFLGSKKDSSLGDSWKWLILYSLGLQRLSAVRRACSTAASNREPQGRNKGSRKGLPRKWREELERCRSKLRLED
jgi:hypothetical protein